MSNWAPNLSTFKTILHTKKRCIYLCYGLETKGLKNIIKKYSGILRDKTINEKLMSTPNYDQQNYATVSTLLACTIK